MRAPSFSRSAPFASVANTNWARNMSPKKRITIRVELLAIFAASVLVFLVAARIELSERLAAWLRPYELWQIDELTHAFLALSIGLGWFSFQRLRESRREVAMRVAAQSETERLLAQNQSLIKELFQVQEIERRDLARELHDELGQCLTAIKVDASTIAAKVRHQDQTALACAEAISETAERMYGDVRSLLRKLRPDTLDGLGLSAALRTHVETWQQRHRVPCELTTDASLGDCGEQINIALYRLVQEGLTNIAKHADARKAAVALRRSETAVTLTIEDDGRGIESETGASGLGILGMRERVRALGGSMQLGRGRHGGTHIAIAIPLMRYKD